MAYTKYSLTPSSNTAAPPDGAPEGMLPSAVNDTMRDMMAQIRDCGDGIRGGTYTLTAPVVTGGSISGASGSFTTLAASSTVSGTGFSTYLASPPAIGGTAAAAVSSTNLAYTGTLTGGTGIVNLGSGQFYKDASGNIGVGTASPSAKLDVAGNAVLSGTSGYKYLYFNGATESSSLRFAKIGKNYDSTFDLGIWASTHTAGNSAATVFYRDLTTESMRIDSSGSVSIGTASAVAKLTVAGASTTFSNAAFAAQNSALINLFYVRCDGAINTGLSASSPYNLTTGTAANAVFANDGFLYRSTSSLKYKTNVQDSTHGLNELLQLRAVTYKGKSEHDGNKVFGGLIAEEVAAIGLTEFVQYADDGTPDALAYGNMVSICIKAIQELNAKVTALETQLGAK